MRNHGEIAEHLHVELSAYTGCSNVVKDNVRAVAWRYEPYSYIVANVNIKSIALYVSNNNRATQYCTSASMRLQFCMLRFVVFGFLYFSSLIYPPSVWQRSKRISLTLSPLCSKNYKIARERMSALLECIWKY